MGQVEKSLTTMITFSSLLLFLETYTKQGERESSLSLLCLCSHLPTIPVYDEVLGV